MILSFLAVISVVAVFSRVNSYNVAVYFFDVGQGDAILISAGSNQVLIDGGPSGIILEKLGRTMPFYDKKIELVVASHLDSDHISGLIDVMKRYEVERVMTTGAIETSQTAFAFNQIIEQKNIVKLGAFAGQKAIVYPGVYIEVLYPFFNLEGKQVKDDNNLSVVTMVHIGEKTFLLTGDAEEAAERQLMIAGLDLEADVLKVGHHGSKNSTTDKFLSAVNPGIAVIQVGANNRYGHPSQRVLDSLSKVNVLRNDLMGDIVFKFNRNFNLVYAAGLQ